MWASAILCLVYLSIFLFLFAMFSWFPVNDISSLCLDVERYSLHQYSLRTNNWHISTEHSVIWRGVRCDGVTTDLKALHPSIPDIRIERNHTMHCFCRSTYAPLFHIPHTHFIRFGCFDFRMCMPLPSVFCRSRRVCTFESSAKVERIQSGMQTTSRRLSTAFV